MTFIEHEPIRKSCQNKNSIKNSVKMSFCKKTNHLKIYIGREIAEKIKLTEKDKVNFYIDSTDKRKWFIKKSENENEGYRASLTTYKHNSIKIQITFRTPEVFKSDSDCRIRMVSHSFENDGLLIFI